jgi:uncharacterized membrane protein YphA (DoxX/SURF4 family)
VSAAPSRAAVLAWVSTVVRLVLGGILVTAGALKAIDPQGSVAAVRAYELLPGGLETIVGWALPFAEIALGLLLIAGVATRALAVVTVGLLVIFIVAVISAAARRLSIDCGCFGGGGEVAAGQTAYGVEIARDLGFLMLALWLVWHPRSRFALGRTDQENDVEEVPDGRT